MYNKIFDNYFFNYERLIKYGFKIENEIFTFKKDILNNSFSIFVYIDVLNNVEVKVLDNAFNEEYVLYKINTSEGEFVGSIRTEIDNLLNDIKNNCCTKSVFKSSQAIMLINYIKEKYNNNLEFLWEKFDDTAIIRRSDNKKWYFLITKLNNKKLGINKDEIVEIIDLRVDKNKPSIVDNEKIFAGYHMNKKSWITICLDNSLETEEIINLLDNSYKLAGKK